MNKEERQAALEAICRLEPDAKNYREEYPTQCESADGDAMIVRAALESEIKKTAMSEKKAAFPCFLYVGRVGGDRLICFEADESDETKYIRADIQSRQLKYKRVDLETLKRVAPIRDRANGFYSSASHVVDGYNSAINDIKAKYGELYVEVKE